MNLRLAAMVVFSFWVDSARADIAFHLDNTGVDGTGNPLFLGAFDPHWTLTGPGIATPVAARVTTTQSPLGLYAPDSGSRWISVADELGMLSEPYYFRLTFDLTGFNSDTAVLSGKWGVDNNELIRLNGSDSGIGSGTLSLSFSSLENFNRFHSFELTDGFVPGMNTLEIEVINTAAWIALNVNSLAGTAAPIPEPGIPFLWVFGVSFLARWRNRQTIPAKDKGASNCRRLGND